MAEYVVVDKTQLEADLTTVADAIRTKGGTTEQLEFPQGMADAVGSIETGITPTGTIQITENGEYDVTEYASANVNVESGENPLEYATNIEQLFQLAVFPSGTEHTINVPNFKENANRCFRYTKGIKRINFKGNTNNNTISLQYAFQQYTSNTELEIVDFSEFGDGGIKPTYANNGFSEAVLLHSILGIIDFSNVANINNMFGNCRALVNVALKPNSLSKTIGFINSPLLSDESIQSIIEGLADLTGADAQTITLHADVKAKLTEEQIAQITSKNWTLA